MSRLCRFCGQPMKPKWKRKRPGEYDHARGCRYARPQTKSKVIDLMQALKDAIAARREGET